MQCPFMRRVGWCFVAACPRCCCRGGGSLFSSKELFLNSSQLQACSSANQTGGYLWRVGGLEPLRRTENPLWSLGLHLPFSACPQGQRIAAALLLLPLLHFLSEGKSLHCPSAGLPGVFCSSCVAHTPVPDPETRAAREASLFQSSGCSASPSIRRLCPAKVTIN